MIRKTNVFFKIPGIIFVSMGGLFLLLSLAFAIVLSSGAVLNPDDITSFNALIYTFLGIGILFAIMGVVFFLIWKRGETKEKRLKNEGICYDAEITEVKISPYGGYGRYGYYGGPSVIVECWYRNQEGRTCLVKSGGLMMSPMLYGAGKDSLRAKVYVNRDDPTDYFVDVTAADHSEMKFDNDYR